jgi:group II intron reverse transcriptase/maturase
MRNAETVLTIIRERGKKHLPLERIYRLLYNKELYLRAYARLYPNDGAMTRGITTETVDAMSQAKIEQLIDDIRHERFSWTPVKRIYIPKKNGKLRPLGIPTWSDKLLQEVLRSILEAYYEPQFSPRSHGFRPGRGCHSALTEIQQQWTGTRWFIEGDIARYFDTINHELLMKILGEHIHDNRFLQLICNLLQAGYMEEWAYHTTLSGTPQGGVISPLLSNIYLNKFDQYVEKVLVPEYTQGDRRRENPAYARVSGTLKRMKQKGKKEGVQSLLQQRRQLPSSDPDDPGYRRLRYIRYADDFALGLVGTHADAEEVKRRLKEFLRDELKLELSEEKTLITHATTQKARFLGYHISNQQANSKTTTNTNRIKKRSVNGRIGLHVPPDVNEKKCAPYMKAGKPIHRPELQHESDFAIMSYYQQVYRGIVQYYLLAHNVAVLGKLRYVMKGSLLKTLAGKHKTTMSAMRRKYQTTTTTAAGKTLQCLEVRVEREGKHPLIARFGGISLTRTPMAVLNDIPYVDKNSRSELIDRLRADRCELCKSTKEVEVHHIRKLADLNIKGRREVPEWKKRMAAMHRKTLILCRTCHVKLHAGTL